LALMGHMKTIFCGEEKTKRVIGKKAHSLYLSL